MVDDRLVAVERANERDDATLEIEGVGESEALVRQGDLQPLVQVSHLAQSVLDDFAVELGVREDLRIGPEPHDGARAIGLADDLDAAFGHATRELLVVNLSAPVHPHLQALAEEVDRRNPDPMQARRDLVATPAELAAGVESCENKLEGREPLFLVDVDRDAATVVVDLDAAVREKGDDDPGCVPRQRLVNGVVDDLVDQVMQAFRGRRSDVHARTPPDMLPALEDLDLLGGVRHVGA